jgi:hypothetical protein
MTNIAPADGRPRSLMANRYRRLVARGLARARKERDGGRARNRYEITPKGRRALRAWLAAESGPPRPNLEPLLRLTFADQGEIPDALAAVGALREWAVTLRAAGMQILHGYRDGDAPFPGRSHINVLNSCFYLALYDATITFADMAEKEIKTWPHTAALGMTERTQELLDKLLAAE